MKAEHYREILSALEVALDTMQKGLGDFTLQDHHLAYQLDLLRTNVLHAKEGDPSPLRHWVVRSASLN